jgi:DUF4097 and DUF4098 domain-containing protein YvlB
VDEPLAFGSKLWVRNRNGAIRVMGWDKEQVDLVAEIRDTNKRKVTLVVQRKGNDLDIEAQTSQPTFSFGFTVTPRCEMILQVPRKLLGHFRTINGAVTLRQLDGYARLETTNGTITAEDVSGEVHADTTNGNVELRRLKARAKIGTTNGKISVEQVDGGIQAETTNGSIRARGLDGWNEGLRFETTNGSIDVELGKATGELIAENSNGRIDVEVKGATVVESSKHSLRLKIPGRTQKISLETTNGSITVR